MNETKKVINLVIYGTPVPQSRPKFARIGNHVTAYDPAKSKNYKQLVRLWATNQLKKIDGFKPLQNALCVEADFYLGIPTSWSKKKRVEASCGVIRPIKKPDLDNLYKAVTDALNGLVWADDAIITDVQIRKRYTADTARVELRIHEVR